MNEKRKKKSQSLLSIKTSLIQRHKVQILDVNNNQQQRQKKRKKENGKKEKTKRKTQRKEKGFIFSERVHFE
jgi:vacuolar-type H+-ATPase subunit I/STV1